MALVPLEFAAAKPRLPLPCCPGTTRANPGFPLAVSSSPGYPAAVFATPWAPVAFSCVGVILRIPDWSCPDFSATGLSPLCY